MTNHVTRRQFMAATGAVLTTTTVTAAATANVDSATKPLIHNVYFWLKNPLSQTDKNMLVKGLNSLRAIPAIKALYIGLPANTEKRDAVDNSFQVSELMFFDDIASQAAYQSHPLHIAFVEQYAHLWQTVVVHDSIAI